MASIRTQVWRGVLASLAVIVIAGVFWRGPELWDRYAGETTGTIFISGPQVYTRERLVNDRYREDAWLLSELDASAKTPFGITASQTRRVQSNRSLSAGIGADTTGGAAATTPASTTADAPSVRIEPTPFDRLQALLAYREQVRTLVIENQLDDRHDLRGNSLYRLRFDAALLPGRNTRQSANVVVSVLPPPGLIDERIMTARNDDRLSDEEKRLATLSHLSRLSPPGSMVEPEVWRRIYTRWLDSLEKRFDDARKELHKAYEDNLFTPQDYDVLLDDMRRDIASNTQSIDAQARLAGSTVELPTGSIVMPSLTPEQKKSIDQFRAGIVDGLTAPTLSALKLAEMDDFRRQFSTFDHASAVGMPAHSFLKDEAKRLVARANESFGLFADVSRSLQPGTGAGPAVPGPTFGQNNIGGGAEHSTDWYLDHAFQERFARAVLGLEPPQGSLPGTPALDSIAELQPLAHVTASFGATAGPAFRFGEQTASFTVTDALERIPDERRAQAQRRATSIGPVWVLGDQIDAISTVLPNYDVGPDVEEAAAQLAREKPQDGFVVWTVHEGLINFIRRVGRRLDAFSYAFTPSEPDQLISTRTVEERRKSLATRAASAMFGADGRANLQMDDSASDDAAGLATRKLVVGYGEQYTSAIPRFGWLLQPQIRGSGGDYLQGASQTSLTALISLPAWWEEIRVRVDHSWTDDRGRPGIPAEPTRQFTIELPVSFETMDASLFELTDRSPSIHDWGTSGMKLRACESADIPIPGRRLWRSTVVTLGGQKADEIFVMPDMNGIIATFKQVQVPATWQDTTKPFPADITVWTSQGSARLPYPAMFMPRDARDPPHCPSALDKPARAGQAAAASAP